MPRSPEPVQRVLADAPQALLGALEQAAEHERLARCFARDLYLAGMSWADIGRLVGTTRQAARQRFGAEVEAWLAEHPDGLMPWDVPAAHDAWWDDLDPAAVLAEHVAAQRFAPGMEV